MAGVRGQGRQFDVDDVLDRAAAVFWRHGYEGSSMAVLTRAMGITASSVYAAFGSKDELFRAVVERYSRTAGDFTQRAFEEEGRALDVIDRLLADAARMYPSGTTPGGCLVISAALCVAEAHEEIAERLRLIRVENIRRLEARLRDDVARGVLVMDVGSAELANYVGAVVQGMAQRGRDGADQAELARTAALARDVVTRWAHSVAELVGGVPRVGFEPTLDGV